MGEDGTLGPCSKPGEDCPGPEDLDAKMAEECEAGVCTLSLETRFAKTLLGDADEIGIAIAHVGYRLDDEEISSWTTVPAGRRLGLGRSSPNGDGEVDLSDALRTLGHLLLGHEPPDCPDAADANDDGGIDISDAVGTLGFLFLGSAAPPAPGPFECGADPTGDALGACAPCPGA